MYLSLKVATDGVRARNTQGYLDSGMHCAGDVHGKTSMGCGSRGGSGEYIVRKIGKGGGVPKIPSEIYQGRQGVS